MEQLIFDNHDDRIKYYELLLERSLIDLPHYELPEGYSFVFYQHGDKTTWINIEISAKEFHNIKQGQEAWERYYGAREKELFERMVFIENADGKKVATATAFYDIFGCSQPDTGWLHWVAVCQEYQGKGLSKPLISYVLNLMREFGYIRAIIPTQTTTWLACSIYLSFGFQPLAKNSIESRNGWRIIKTLTNHAALDEFDVISMNEILNTDVEY